MAEYADIVAGMPIVRELRSSAGRDQIPPSEVDQLYGLVLRIADEAGPLLSRIPATFKQYTEHDIRHSRNLLDLCGRLVPPTTLKQLNAVEFTILILAILLHDFGMFVSEEEKQETLSSIEFIEFLRSDASRQKMIDSALALGNTWSAEYLRDAALAEYFRRVHPERAAINIDRYISFPMMYREFDLRPHVAILAASHGWNVHEPSSISHPKHAVRNLRTNQPAYGAPVNLQFLACCLRLADILDFDRSRTPLSVFKATSFSEERSRLEWNKHLQVSGWTVTPTEVAYAAECSHPAFWVAVNQFLDLVDREIQECRHLLGQSPGDISARYELRLSPLVDRSRVDMADKSFIAGAFRFELDYERIMALLMDRSLYGDPSLFARELVQNAADACRYAAALASDAGAAYTPRIIVEELIVNGQRCITVCDNGIGMSLQVFLDYFLKVGRSFYRSHEFLAIRSQLASSGVTLEATSQFGIGVLSCFMVADGLKIDTYRRGHAPLHITVDGPTKYFVIQQMPEPRPRDFDRTSDELHSRPPERPGTRIELTITKALDVDIVASLRAAAVNLEFDVTLVDHSGELTFIDRDGWRASPTVDDRRNAFGGSNSLIGGPDWALHDRNRRSSYDLSVYDVLVPSVVPLNSIEATGSFRGAAWIWLLRGADGHPTPVEGYLRVGDSLHLRGVPAVLGELVSTTQPKQYLVFEELRFLGDALKTLINQDDLSDGVRKRLFTLYSEADDEDQDADDLTDAFAIAWKGFTQANRELFCRSLASLTNKSANWRTVPGLAERLLAGDTSWSEESIEFTGDMPFSTLPQRYAIFGMGLPAGILRWDPSAGFARKVRIFHGPVGLKIDFRGHGAPRPAASRLFVEAVDASDAAVALIRAVIRHAGNLASAGNTGTWHRWFRAFLSKSASLPYWHRAMLEELPALESLPVYRAGDVFLTGNEVRDRLGRWVTIESNQQTEIQMNSWSGLNYAMFALRPHKTVGETTVVDMETAVPPKNDSFHELGRFDSLFDA